MLIVAVLAACVAISAAQGAAGPAAQPPNPPVVTDPLVAAQLLAAAEVDARLFKEIVPVANSDNSTSERCERRHGAPHAPRAATKKSVLALLLGVTHPPC